MPNFSLNLLTFFQLFNAANWCKELTIFTRIDYFSIPLISCSVDFSFIMVVYEQFFKIFLKYLKEMKKHVSTTKIE